MFCNHANESPQYDPYTGRCTCINDCYCKVEGMCRLDRNLDNFRIELKDHQGNSVKLTLNGFKIKLEHK